MPMDAIVVDASIVVKWLNQEKEQSTEKAFAVLESAREGRVDLISTDILIHEVFNALVRGKGVRGEHLQKAFTAFCLFPISIIPTDKTLIASTILIAEQYGMTIYDALYVALAIDEDVILLTANIRHQGRMKRVAVVDLADWQGEDALY